ncbi:UPF0182 family protein [Roseisolibacter sp. H3M3-2]|uniref:UPF0182 family protein n=1 Tax=Roseisolibacter sp. H3M3-2 TaxID=3031323 RepID=UPI0023DB0768|nr:UPF0182 family protein [Roseisolibacter sp. H3M3-2]MDF1501989.1 UPF0182 family protein [Roseisolibacter sp. H3M3-2]
MNRRRFLALALAAAALLLMGRAVAELVVERRWYAAFGPAALDVWRAREFGLWLLRGSCALAAALVCFANLYGVVSSVERFVLPRRLGDLEIGETVPGHRLLWAAAALSLAVGALLALPLDAWQPVIALRAGGSFAELEPFTGHDLGYHVHWLPLEHALYTWALFVLLAVGALVLACYALTPGLRVVRGRVRLSNHVRRHVTVLGVGLLLLLAWGHRLDAYSLLVAGSGENGLFTLADHRAGLPVRFGLGIATALASLAVLRAGWAGQPRLAFWVVTGVLGLTLISRWMAPLVLTQMTRPDERARLDAAYAQTRALYTRRAYAADAVRPAPAGYGVDSLPALAARTSVWDPAALLKSMERARRGGTPVAEVGWQAAPDGGLRALLVERPESAPSDVEFAEWTVVSVDAARTDADGRPLAVTTDVRALEDAGRRIDSVLVYPDAVGLAVVPQAARDVVGDPVDGWGTRLAHAWARRDLRLAFRTDFDAARSPKLVYRRDPRERVRALAPFFAQGDALHPALVGDSLFWVLHLYAASDAYPLSAHYLVARSERSYFQHAAVAIVNARSGAVRLVADSAPGALARVWIRRFPRLFLPSSAVDQALAAAIPPPTDGALIQSLIYAQHGARGAGVIAPRRLTGGMAGDSAIWSAARAPSLLPAPAGGRPTPAWTLPLVDAASRLDGIVVVLGGASPTSLWVPARPAYPRWPELADQLRGALAAAVATIPAAGGAPVSPKLGQLRVLPVRGDLAFLQPAYDDSRDVPSVTAVVAATADTTRVGRTLASALGAEPTEAGAAQGDRLTRARGLYEAMRQALQRGDWARFGRTLDSLGAAVGAPR